MIIAGDIGGTHTRLGAFTTGSGAPRLAHSAEYPSRQYPGLYEITADFLKTVSNKPVVFCFGVAGPVIDGQAHVTNLAWIMDQAQLARSLGAPVVLINDLEANAYGIAALGPKDLVTLQAGRAGEHGNACVVSAGTGLGEAGLLWDGARHHPFACEGGHSTFAPRTREEIALLEYLTARFPDHVSWERVLSGPGLVNVYQFLRDTGRGSEPSWLAEAVTKEGASAIAHAAIHGKSELCERALDLFVSLYGSEAGNVALKLMAIGGVYLGGGIAPKIVGKLKEGQFLRAFAAKGRMRETLERIPVHVITNDKTALMGAALCGARAIVQG